MEDGGNGNGASASVARDWNKLLQELYAELRARAERFTRGQGRDLTLQPTALVHEACLKLVGREELAGKDHAHILALASTAMRSVLVDHARARGRIKRLPPGERIPIEEVHVAFEERAVDLLALDAALSRLAGFDPRMARVVELHFFGGLSLADTARALGMPLRTLERRWAATRAWLRAEIG
jgi:RNA polymerase sigma factor (TIGR02999 family)